jgi:hypothetical protein
MKLFMKVILSPYLPISNPFRATHKGLEGSFGKRRTQLNLEPEFFLKGLVWHG